MKSKRLLSSKTDPANPIISFRRVSRFYKPDKAALFDLTFDIYPGEFVYVAGTSGAGKSTLLRLIHAEEMPDTGAILYGGHNLVDLRKTAIAMIRRSMGVIFQNFLLVPDISVAANVSIPLEVAAKPFSEIASRVETALELVGLAGRGEEKAETLSGGEQQRVAIARALITEPELVLADEPTGSLDDYNADFVLDLLERATKRGTTVVLATHDRMLMAARPHRTIALDQGRVTGISSSPAENRTTEQVSGTDALGQMP
jgi:cell division transport system ATP-binding protein